MFSNNDMISSRQIKRLLIFDLFGISSLLLPTQLAGTGGGMGIWCILAGIGLALFYLWMLQICLGRAAQDYLEYLSQGFGTFLAKLFYVCYGLICIMAGAYTSKLLSELMCDSLLDSREFPVALLIVLLLALYGGIAGLEARARVYEIMFWVLVIPLLVMLALCVRQVQAIQWFPIVGHMDEEAAMGFWSGAWRCFMAFLPLTFLLFLVPNVKDKKKTGYAAVCALTVSGLALCIIYLILLGIFGSRALMQEQYPIITLMGMVKIPGEFIKRLDALMVGVWFFTLYAMIGSSLYYGVSILRRAFAKSAADKNAAQKNEPYKKSCYFAAAAAVYGIAYGFYLLPETEHLAGRLFAYIGVPFLMLVPMLSLFLCRGKAHNKGSRVRTNETDHDERKGVDEC